MESDMTFSLSFQNPAKYILWNVIGPVVGTAVL